MSDSHEGMNLTQVNIGCQRSGKSFDAMATALEVGARYDAKILIHDLGDAAIRKPHFDNQLDWTEYHTSKPRYRFQESEIVVINTADGEDVIDFFTSGKSIRDYALKKRDSKRNTIIVIDEVTACKHINPSGIGEPWKSLVAQRHNLKVGLIVCMQSPTLASRFLTSTATSVKCFRINDERNHDALKSVGYSKEQIAEIRKLPPRKYLELLQGFGDTPNRDDLIKLP